VVGRDTSTRQVGAKGTEDDPPPGLQAGRVGRAHGLDGSFYVTSPRPRLLSLGTGVTVAGRHATIVRRAGTEQRPIVRLEGVQDREGADALRGVALTVDRLQAPALKAGEWWAHELEGCTVVDAEQRVVGTVSRMIELPSCEALEVRRETIGSHAPGAPLIVPMVKDAIRRMAVAEGRIEVDMGFLGEGGLDQERGPRTGTGDPETGEDGAEESGLAPAEGVPEAGEDGTEAREDEDR
jgi:16S rRNA processing protein RimM